MEAEQGRSCLSQHQQLLPLPVPAHYLPKTLLMGFISVGAAQGEAPGLQKTCHYPAQNPRALTQKHILEKKTNILWRVINSHSTPTYFRQACLDKAPGVNLDFLPSERAKHKTVSGLCPTQNTIEKQSKESIAMWAFKVPARLFSHDQPANEQTRHEQTAALNIKCQQTRQKLGKTVAL